MKQESQNINTWILAWGLTGFLAVLLAFVRFHQTRPSGYFWFTDARQYCLGMILYADDHGRHYPTNLNQTLPYLRQANYSPDDTNAFEILFQGSMDFLTNSPSMAGRTIVLRSEPWLNPDGKWARIYGFADGHCETHYEIVNNFTNWENLHWPGSNPTQ